MKILFSYPTKLENEASIINNEMSSGNWDLFHLRKPNWAEQEVEKLLKELTVEVQSKTIIHKSGKQSCHSFDDVEAIDGKEEYCFLSPIFDSISKKGYRANFEKSELKAFLKKERKIKVIALGGITEENYLEVLELGFDGGAFLGSVWSIYLCHSERYFYENLFSSKNDLKNL
ncbi:MAG: thiamine phosphate synthase [Flavobacteriales bacterium]|nr:thiamine phosphate synthase [Flavobacteriales bacterium]